MKAAIFHGPEKIEVTEWKKPVCLDEEILIKVEYCAICGTDVRTFFHGHKKVIPPAIIGHEITGEVVEVGKNIKGLLKKGDRITPVTSIGCGHCRLCSKGLYNLCPDTKALGYFYPGGFAEYMIIPDMAVKQKAWVVLPDNISLLEGSLIEPLSCVINAQNYLAIRPGDSVVIYGGGPIGFMHAILARASGAEKIIMVDPAYERLEKFASLFSDLILINPLAENTVEKIKSITDGFGADVIITACPAKQAQVESFRIAAPRSRISFFGGLPKDDSVISIDSNLIHYYEISVFGAFASNRVDYQKAVDLISSRKIDPSRFITEVISLKDIERGIRMVKDGSVLKVVVRIQE
ncbi:MAG: zinc-dependent dehydrogenase [Candidatus Omnitrophica bacterium]|nr:zinc-dependent dehydrogenase [Candidatus Omnitrophota bacterium]MCM8788544.1 zinc-dependent dehydrogenase [Candidatus Omnitrophota bacterium]